MIFDEDGETELGRLQFPRQERHDRLCIADYFRTIDDDERDIVAFQVVTVGREAQDHVDALYAAEEYSEQYFAQASRSPRRRAWPRRCTGASSASWAWRPTRAAATRGAIRRVRTSSTTCWSATSSAPRKRSASASRRRSSSIRSSRPRRSSSTTLGGVLRRCARSARPSRRTRSVNSRSTPWHGALPHGIRTRSLSSPSTARHETWSAHVRFPARQAIGHLRQPAGPARDRPIGDSHRNGHAREPEAGRPAGFGRPPGILDSTFRLQRGPHREGPLLRRDRADADT